MLTFFPGLFAVLTLHTYSAVPFAPWQFYASSFGALASALVFQTKRIERRRTIVRIALLRSGEELRLLLNSGNEIQIGVREIRLEDPGSKDTPPSLDVQGKKTYLQVRRTRYLHPDLLFAVLNGSVSTIKGP